MKRIAICLLTVLSLPACVHMKPVELYEQASDEAPSPSIDGVSVLSIFSDQITSELWFTVSPDALNVKAEAQQVHTGNGAFSIEWNKQADPSTWLGLGIGWADWTGKDLSPIVMKSALSFWVKMKQGQSRGLPWAVGFEDFSGGQAWTGITADCVKGGIIGSEWTQVLVPLSNFPFAETNTDADNIKQVIFQFESSGKAWVDDISLVPYTSIGRQQNTIKPLAKAPLIDGSLGKDEWAATTINTDSGSVYINFDNTFLYIAADIKDASPLQNKHNAADIWNGDAIELAFSTRSGLSSNRRILYPEDYHLGFKIGASTEVFDWANKRAIQPTSFKVKSNANGYTMEAAIPWSLLGGKAWEIGQQYDLEVAIDLGNGDARQQQIRWNSAKREGFNTSPALWGSLSILP